MAQFFYKNHQQRQTDKKEEKKVTNSMKEK